MSMTSTMLPMHLNAPIVEQNVVALTHAMIGTTNMVSACNATVWQSIVATIIWPVAIQPVPCTFVALLPQYNTAPPADRYGCTMGKRLSRSLATVAT